MSIERARRTLLAGLSLVAAGLAAPGASEAAILFYELRGRVLEVDTFGEPNNELLAAVRPDGPLSGVFAFRTNGNDRNRNPDVGYYRYTNRNGFGLQSRGASDAIALDDFSVAELGVVNDGRRGDEFNYSVRSFGTVRTFGITLVDTSGEAFDDDSIPSPRELRRANFDRGLVAYAYMNVAGGFNEFFTALPVSFGRVPSPLPGGGGGGGAVVTPVPAALPLLAAALGGLAMVARRRPGVRGAGTAATPA